MARQVPEIKRLDVDTVVATALRIADREGLGSLSMRRLASELGVTPMALYNHVTNKQQLVDLMADHALRTLPEIDVDGRWDEELERLFLAFHRLFVAHPAVAAVTVERPVEGPVAIRIGDRILELLGRSGFDDDHAVETFVTLFNYTVGASLYRLSRHRPHAQRLAQIDPQTAPTAHRLRRHLARASDERQFEHALRRIVAGLQPA